MCALTTVSDNIAGTPYPMYRVEMFGKAGTAAVLEELQKLQEREEIEPQLASNPTSQESLG